MAELTKIGYIKSLYSDQMKEHDLHISNFHKTLKLLYL